MPLVPLEQLALKALLDLPALLEQLALPVPLELLDQLARLDRKALPALMV